MGTSVPSRILLDSTELTDSKDIANAFNDFFINVGKFQGSITWTI
jgi:hypothetical protein